jgi:Fur family zinc uptake transcriptional regulator
VSEHQAKIQYMLDAMSKKGWRITEQRRSLATLFVENIGYLSPKDVYEHMRQAYPGISFDTVYRNLRLLSEMDVLEQTYLPDGLKFKVSCLTHHHHHLICLHCEKTVAFDYCPMTVMAHIPETFHVINHRFEVFGYCDNCKNQRQTQTIPTI